MMGGSGMMGYTGGIGAMGGWGLFGGILMLLFWVFVVAGAVWLVLAVTRTQGRGERNDDALAILAERLARGEIDTEEYRLRRTAIRGER